MIVVKVELWPYGQALEAEVLGVMCVANTGSYAHDGTGDKDEFYYDVELQKTTGPRSVVQKRIIHWRRHGWERLVRKAFEAVT